ncbi:MarR family winged helix-turn-helix transcriptional regulator [Roseomonas sp. CCTCC AB2023176]|uniref:MarR family winged helix-turn-helix transcriptional regulator n=1 Tax=Roseomonas sp. CCTCC AB2023176 TaxID=3342640 RepID=UPI0035D69D0F
MTEIIKVTGEPFSLSLTRPHADHSRRVVGHSETDEDVGGILLTLVSTCEKILRCIGEDPGGSATLRGVDGASEPVKATPTVLTGSLSTNLKQMLKLRARRRRKFEGHVFDWPAWDMLLDLAAVRAEGGHVSVSAVCISSGAPQSTALRKLAGLERAGLIRRYMHGTDRRRVCLTLTDEASALIVSVLQEEVAFYRSMSGNR